MTAIRGRMFSTRGAMLDSRLVRHFNGRFAEDGYDFGIWWRDDCGGVYRLTWVGARGRGDVALAGELYLERVNVGARDRGWFIDRVELLCIIPPVPTTPDENDRPEQRVSDILDGWAEVCGEPNSVAWIRDRVAEALQAGWAEKV
jgi:hypothetical protein